MPHIILCGRYWRFSGDELPVTAVCAIVGRFCALIILVSLFILTDNDARECHDGFNAYLLSSMTIFSCSIIVECFIIYHGLQGTMVQMAKRRRALERFLKLHYAFSVMQLALTVWGLLLFGHTWKLACATDVIDHTDKVLLTLVIVVQFIDVVSQYFCCFLLKGGSAKGRGQGGRIRSRTESDTDTDAENSPSRPVLGMGSDNKYHLNANGDVDSPSNYAYNGGDVDEGFDVESREKQKVWEKRCSFLCKCTRFFSCGIFGGSNVASEIEAVARVMTTFFHHDGFLDVVPSDVLAGILLVRLQQRSTLMHYHSGELRASLHGNINNITRGDDGDGYGVDNTSSHIILNLESGGGNGNEFAAVVGVNTNTSLSMRTRRVLDAQRRLLSQGKIDDVECVRMSARMCQFAFAIYTHLLYIFDKPATGLCRLTYSCVAGQGCATETSVRGLQLSDRVEGDGCLHLNHAAAAAVASEMGSAEIVFASYSNDAIVKPYAIFLDHDTECVVIALRGTLSLEDCLTDAICEPVELTDAGLAYGFDGKGRWAHGGILRAAMAIRSDISRKGVLQAVFKGDLSGVASGGGVGTSRSGSRGSFASDRTSLDVINGMTSTSAYPHYGITLVGHSLGAGTAVLLALLMRAEYPTLNCYGFGCPGSLLDPVTSEECRDWLTQVVMDNDIIPRLGLPTLNHLREEVLSSITRAKVNKTYIMKTLVEEAEISEFLYPIGQAPESDFKDAVEGFTEHMRKTNETMGVVHDLVLPGRIITLVKKGRYGNMHGGASSHKASCMSLCSAMCCCFKCKNKNYQLQETTRDAFAEIVVSPSMVADHMPDKYVNELVKLRDDWTGESFKDATRYK